MKKMTSLFIVVLLMTSFVSAETYHEEDYMIIPDDMEWVVYRSDNGLPTDTEPFIVQNGAKYYFNKSLLNEKGIIVYGDYRDIGRNDFKEVIGGYYQKRTTGEYRYHGYTADGGYHGNDDFPRDASSATPLEEKNWIYTPWDEGSFGYDHFINNSGELATFNKDAFSMLKLRPIVANELIVTLNDAMPFEIKRGTYTGTDTVTEQDFVYYANVQTPQTMRLSGQTIMFHKSVWDGKAWYQTFPLLRTSTKTALFDVEATIPEYAVVGINPSGAVVVKVKVVGHLQDEAFYDDEAQKYVYYNREDIDSWDFTLTSHDVPSVFNKVGDPVRFNEGNMAYQWFNATIPYEAYKTYLKEDGSFDLLVDGEATVYFPNEQSLSDGVMDILKIDGGSPITEEITDDSVVDVSITAPNEILDVWSFHISLSENFVPDDYDRSVILEGVTLSENEANKFLSGTYNFPIIQSSKIYNYKIIYSNGIEEYDYSSWVLVYDSLPHASVRVTNYNKVNRKNSITSDIGVTPDFVEANTTISTTEFSIIPRSGQTVYYDTNNLYLKEYMIKEVDTVDVRVTVSNEYGSRTYTHEVYSGEDYIPDLISIIWNNNLARGDVIDVFSEGASLDDDYLGAIYYEIFFDHDKDGVADQSVNSKEEFTGTIDYIPASLGYYEVEFSIKEVAFGQPTIEAYIYPEDYKENIVRRELIVDNLIPMTKIYSDVEYNFPEVEVTLLVDEDYPREELNYIRDNNVAIRNNFRLASMVAEIKLWDLHTYEYSKTQTYYRNTGSSYPPNTYHYSSGGYTGTLTLSSVSNSPYTRDLGSYETQVEFQVFTTTRSQSGSVYYPQYTDADRTPSSIAFNQNGFIGTMYKQSGYAYYNYGDIPNPDGGDPIGYWYNMARNYRGTGRKETQVWVPNIVSYNDYTGRYSGTIYKYVKQIFTPTYSTNTNKYIVYLTTDHISNSSDFYRIKEIAPDSTIIMVSNASVADALNEQIHLSYTSDTSSVMNALVSVIQAENQFSNVRTVLVGESFQIETSDADAEGDPIVETGLQIVHDPSIFDNPMTLENGAYSSYDSSQFSSFNKTSFDNAGLIQYYRRIKDAPVSDPLQGKYSNLAALDLVVHRKPIALDRLDWTFNSIKGVYETSWVDLSYDPDFQYSDINKGIVNRKMKIKKDDESWQYYIPAELTPGSYDREMMVQDRYGAWSDVYSEHFVLSDKPSPQILDGKLKSTDEQFNLSSIPHTESVTLYDLVTRFPYEIKLKYEWVKDYEVKYSETLEMARIQVEGDMLYEPIDIQIPKAFADGDYQLIVYAIDDTDINNYESLTFNVSVATPIDLSPTLPEIFVPGSNRIYAETSKYTDEVLLTLYTGSDYEKTVSMIKQDGVWVYEEVIIEMLDGAYLFSFDGVIHSIPPKHEYRLLNSEYVGLSAKKITIQGMWNYYNGDENLFYEPKSLEPHRFLSLEKITIDVETLGQPDAIRIEMSPELEAMVFVDPYGNSYSYLELIGYEEEFPLLMTTSDQNIWHRTYILPLANSTKSLDNTRLRPSYYIEIILIKGANEISYIINDIEITGNTLDHVYLEPDN